MLGFQAWWRGEVSIPQGCEPITKNVEALAEGKNHDNESKNCLHKNDTNAILEGGKDGLRNSLW